MLLIAATNRADSARPRAAAARPLRPPAHLRARRPRPDAASSSTTSSRARRTRAELDDARAPGRAGRRSPRATRPVDDRAPARRGAGAGAAARRARRCPGRTSSRPGCSPRSAWASRWGTPTHEERLIATHEAATPRWPGWSRRTAGWRCSRSSSARAPSGCSRTATADDVYTRSRTELLGLIRIAFGGQVAEELFFGDVSTGPGGDLQYATRVAAQMVGAAGMADTPGVVRRRRRTRRFSDTGLVGRVLGDPEGRRLVEELLQRAARPACAGCSTANRHLVAALRDALLERHELDRPRDHRRPRGGPPQAGPGTATEAWAPRSLATVTIQGEARPATVESFRRAVGRFATGCLRRHRRRRRPGPRDDRQRLHLGVARPAAGPGLRRDRRALPRRHHRRRAVGGERPRRLGAARRRLAGHARAAPARAARPHPVPPRSRDRRRPARPVARPGSSAARTRCTRAGTTRSSSARWPASVWATSRAVRCSTTAARTGRSAPGPEATAGPQRGRPHAGAAAGQSCAR